MNFMKRFFLCLLTICIGQIVCQAYNGTLNVRVGDSFSVNGGSYRYIQAVLWDFDPAIFETVSVSGYSTSGTFKAKAASPTAGSIIQATIYYYKDGAPNSGVVKDVASWKVYVKDEGTNENYTVSLPSTMNIDLNNTTTITATPSSSNYPGSFYWRSNDSNIVEVVSSNGSYATLRANSVGSTYIYVTLDNGNYARVYVTVNDQLEYYILSSTYKTAGVKANSKGWCSGTVTIPSTVKIDGVTYTVTEIGLDAFNKCSEITSVTIPNSVTEIGFRAFSGCSGLKSIKIGDQVSFIDSYAFQSCDGLTKAEFASIESLCNIEFKDSFSNPLFYAHHLYIDGKEVTNMTIPESVTSIGNYAFYGCSGLTSVTIPNSVTSIGSSAFSGCTRLKEISIPNSVTSIGSSAFSCTGIKEFTIPGFVTEILSNPFTSCTSLKEIKVDSHNNYFRAKDGVLYSKDLKTLIAFPGGQSFVNIPNTVTSTGKHAFHGCIYLTSLIIPNSVTIIDDYTFRGCNGLTTLTIPESVTSIGSGAFWNCNGLTSVTIPESISSIGKQAFLDCISLTTVYYNTKEPIQKSSDTVFDSSTYSNATLYVPAETVEKCKDIYPWSEFKNIQAFEFSGVEEIKAEVDADTPYDIYNLNGVRVGDNIEVLTPGIYIVRQGATTKKISVK